MPRVKCEYLMLNKGISPFIAVILLIAFTVGVSGIISVWLSGYTQTTSNIVSNQSTTEITCTYGGISLKNLKYSVGNVSGTIENTGTISLKEIQIQALFKNATSLKVAMCGTATAPFNCSSANLSLSSREAASFNVSIGGSNYNDIRVITNCASVYDEVDASEVST